MAIIGNGTAHNGKIHPNRIRLFTGSPVVATRPSAPTARATGSLRSKLEQRVRVLAHRQRTSESAIVDCALWHFFKTGQAANVMELMDQAGIVPRRRRS
jgi:predicted nuclease with RNAse H fold